MGHNMNLISYMYCILQYASLNGAISMGHTTHHLKLIISNLIFLFRSRKSDIDFFRYCLIFVGSSPGWGDIFFMKSDIKWASFMYSDTSDYVEMRTIWKLNNLYMEWAKLGMQYIYIIMFMYIVFKNFHITISISVFI